MTRESTRPQALLEGWACSLTRGSSWPVPPPSSASLSDRICVESRSRVLLERTAPCLRLGKGGGWCVWDRSSKWPPRGDPCPSQVLPSTQGAGMTASGEWFSVEAVTYDHGLGSPRVRCPSVPPVSGGPRSEPSLPHTPSSPLCQALFQQLARLFTPLLSVLFGLWCGCPASQAKRQPCSLDVPLCCLRLSLHGPPLPQFPPRDASSALPPPPQQARTHVVHTGPSSGGS